MPDGFKIATAWVEAKADDRNLRQELTTAVKKAARGQEFKIPVTPLTAKLRAAVSKAVTAAGKNQKIGVTVAAVTTGLRPAVTAAARAAETGIRIGIPVAAHTAGLRAAVTAAVTAATRGQKIKVPVKVDKTGLRAAVTAAINAAGNNQKFKIPVAAQTTGLRAALRTAINTATAGQRIDLPLGVDAGLLRASISAAVAASAGRHDIGVDVTVKDPMLLRQQVLAAVRWAAWGHKIEIPLKVKDPNDLRAQVAAAVTRAGRTHTIRVNTNLNVRGTLSQIATIRGALAGLNATVRVGVNSTSGALASGGRGWKFYGAIALAVLAGITVAAPMAAAAITATLPIAFGAIGAFALRADKDVKSAFIDMKTSVGSSIREAAAPFKPFLIDAMDEVTEGVQEMKGPLSEAFRAAGPLIDNVADGLVSLGTRALPGITTAMERSGPATQQFGEFLGQVGDGIGGMFEAITAGNETNLAKVWSNMGTGLRDTLVELGQLMGTLTRNESAVESVAVAFELLGDSIELVTKMADGLAPAFLFAFQAMDGLVQQAQFWTDVFVNLFDTIWGGKDDPSGRITTAATATGKYGESAKSAGEAAGGFAAQAEKTAAAMAASTKSAEGLSKTLDNMNGPALGAREAMRQLQEQIDATNTALKENGRTHKDSTEAGRENNAAIDALAASYQKAAAAKVNETGKEADAIPILERGREAYFQAARAAGYNAEEARKLTERVFGMPDQKGITFTSPGSQKVLGELRKLESKVGAIPPGKTITMKAPTDAAIAELRALGFTVEKVPGTKDVKVTAPTGSAVANAERLRAKLAQLHDKSITIFSNHVVRTTREYVTRYLTGRSQHDIVGATGGLFTGRGFKHRGYALGGLVDGPGTETSDDVFAPWLSRNEFVVNAAQTKKHLTLLRAINEGRLRMEGFAKGGMSDKRKEARKSLTSDVTLTDMSHIAGVRNAEISSGLFKERSEGALVDLLNKMQRDVAAAGFSKSTNSRLQAQITSSARSLFAQNDALDKVTKSLEKARETVDDLRGKFDSLKSSVSSSLVGFANVTKIGKFGTSVGTLLGQMRSDTARTGQFTGQLDKLKSMGLNATMLSDIAAAGVTGGGAATATSLLGATPAQIAELNKLQGQLVKSADAAGTTVANSMFGAGLKAAEGLVKGLESQQAAIEASMMRIAKSMEASIRKALGIRSPSEEMRKLGAMTAQGFTLGIEQERGPVRAATRMAHAPVAATTGIAAGGGAAFAPTFEINFNGDVYGDRKQLQRELTAALPAVIPKIKEALRKYDRERARG